MFYYSGNSGVYFEIKHHALGFLPSLRRRTCSLYRTPYHIIIIIIWILRTTNKCKRKKKTRSTRIVPLEESKRRVCFGFMITPNPLVMCWCWFRVYVGAAGIYTQNRYIWSAWKPRVSCGTTKEKRFRALALCCAWACVDAETDSEIERAIVLTR